MPRPRMSRIVGFEPGTTYFKPAGIAMAGLSENVLQVEELEAMRLKDLEEMDQEKAAKKMGVSQPTFHRMLVEARKKVADAIVNGKAIRVHGGNFKFARGGTRRRFRGGGF